MTDQIPHDFDWASARAKCSLIAVFLMLMERVKADVKKAQDVKAGSGERLEIADVSHSKVATPKHAN